uniref:Uncharacterized protein n=1 Tax=Arundo donax TaxID=35708 RepID=A0A0A9AP48_ARUDO
MPRRPCSSSSSSIAHSSSPSSCS